MRLPGSQRSWIKARGSNARVGLQYGEQMLKTADTSVSVAMETGYRLQGYADDGPAGDSDAPPLVDEDVAEADVDAGGNDVLRLALPRYGFTIEWDEAAAGQALPIETIASRFGFQRRPAPAAT